MKKLFALSLMIILSQLSFGKGLPSSYTQTVRGVVIDKHSQSPLIGATVVIIGSEPLIGTVSDLNGEFKIDEVPIGRQTIKISFIGYHPATINNIQLASGKELVLNIELEEQVVKTEEIVVKAHARKDKAINEMAAISARSFTIEETQRYAGSLGDPSRMASNFAGVMSVSDQRNDIIIRGNSPMGLLWRLEGIEIPNPNHFGALGTTGGPVSILNNNLLTNSDFFTGAFPAEYGNAISGAFDLKMRAGNNQKSEYVGQVGFNGFEFGAEGPFSKNYKGSYLASYRYSTLAVFDAMGFNLGTGASIPQYQDLTFKVDLPTENLGKFTLIGIGGISFIQIYDSKKDSTDWSYGLSGTDTDFGSDMGVLGLQNKYFLNENTHIQTNISAQGTRSTTDIDSIITKEPLIKKAFVRLNYQEAKYSISSRIKSKLNAKNTISAGMRYDLYDVNYKDSVWDSDDQVFRTRTDIEGDMGMIQAFGQWQHRFTDELTLFSGIHYQHLYFNNSAAIEPRLGLKWQFLGNQSINLGYGKHSQLQPRNHYFTLSYNEETDQYIKTNENLDFTRSDHYVIGYDNLITENFRLKIEMYYQELKDVPVPEGDSWDFNEVFSMINAGDYFHIPNIDSLVNEGKGKNYGIELTLEKFLSRGYYYLITTSIYDSKYTDREGKERNSAFAGNFVVNALGGKEWIVGNENVLAVDLRSVWAGGKRYIPFDVVESQLQDEGVYDLTQAYKNRFDDYFKIDLRISFKWNMDNINMEWGLDLQNLTNNQNIFSYNWIPSEGDKPGYAKEEYQSGFYPMMLFRVQF